MLICPVCGEKLSLEKTRALCPRGHSFDRAREGYFNLLLKQSTHSHGDDKKMLLDRRLFLEKGYYSPLLEALQSLCLELFPEKGALVDAGCGEGYYTQGVFSFLRERGVSLSGFAFDVSRDAVKMTARRFGEEDISFVATSFHIPLASESADGILSLFSPYTEKEFLRVLKPGGFLIRAFPRRDHLYELKRAVYENPLLNLRQAEIGEDFRVIREVQVEKMLSLTCREDILALFGMTPYAHKTSPEDLAKLSALTSLSTKMDVGIQILTKFSEKTS